MLTIAIPDRKTSTGQRYLTPRGTGTLAAGLFLLATLLFVHTTTILAFEIFLAFAAYAVVRITRTPPDSREDRLIDIAWDQFVPRHVEREAATRFITRLCITSLGRGDPEGRVNALYKIAARARDKIASSDANLQMLAAVSVLQVEDEARYGRDVVAGVASLAAEGFSGNLPPTHAEYVVECYCSRDRNPGDLARLRILLLAAAFDAGTRAPGSYRFMVRRSSLEAAMAMEPAHRLGLLFGVWRTREARAWRSVGAATTVFDLARTSPPTASRVLAQFPDLLLFHRPERDIEDLVGPLLICSRGVAVGGYLTADPDADVH